MKSEFKLGPTDSFVQRNAEIVLLIAGFEILDRVRESHRSGLPNLCEHLMPPFVIGECLLKMIALRLFPFSHSRTQRHSLAIASLSEGSSGEQFQGYCILA